VGPVSWQLLVSTLQEDHAQPEHSPEAHTQQWGRSIKTLVSNPCKRSHALCADALSVVVLGAGRCG
jgi:hypothetical protein